MRFRQGSPANGRFRDNRRQAPAVSQDSRRTARGEGAPAPPGDATFEVHAEQRIAGARLDDIAQRGGVSIGTLYRHFRTYEALVAACGAQTFEHVPPPTAAEADTPLAGVPRRPDCTRRLVDRVLGFYEQTAPMVEVVRRDSAEPPFLVQWVEQLDRGIDAWVHEALDDQPPSVRRIARALVDDRAWTALAAEGVEDVRYVVVALINAAGESGSSACR